MNTHEGTLNCILPVAVLFNPTFQWFKATGKSAKTPWRQFPLSSQIGKLSRWFTLVFLTSTHSICFRPFSSRRFCMQLSHSHFRVESVVVDLEIMILPSNTGAQTQGDHASQGSRFKLPKRKLSKLKPRQENGPEWNGQDPLADRNSPFHSFMFVTLRRYTDATPVQSPSNLETCSRLRWPMSGNDNCSTKAGIWWTANSSEVLNSQLLHRDQTNPIKTGKPPSVEASSCQLLK